MNYIEYRFSTTPYFQDETDFARPWWQNLLAGMAMTGAIANATPAVHANVIDDAKDAIAYGQEWMKDKINDAADAYTDHQANRAMEKEHRDTLRQQYRDYKQNERDEKLKKRATELANKKQSLEEAANRDAEIKNHEVRLINGEHLRENDAIPLDLLVPGWGMKKDTAEALSNADAAVQKWKDNVAQAKQEYADLKAGRGDAIENTRDFVSKLGKSKASEMVDQMRRYDTDPDTLANLWGNAMQSRADEIASKYAIGQNAENEANLAAEALARQQAAQEKALERQNKYDEGVEKVGDFVRGTKANIGKLWNAVTGKGGN